MDLDFEDSTLKESTKHVHGIHPYKGKFFPQLVEKFLEKEFNKKDYILDPFAGSGTTLVQANEMGINSLGIELSVFNTILIKTKLKKYNLEKLMEECNDILTKTRQFSEKNFPKDNRKNKKLKKLKKEFNNSGILEEYQQKIEDKKELKNKLEQEFFKFLENDKEVLYRNEDVRKYRSDNEYLNNFFNKRSLNELLYYKSLIQNYKYQNILKIILTRSARSVRQIYHYDLINPKENIYKPYYCFKHKKICNPVNKAVGKIKRYTKDIIKSIKKFSEIRTKAKASVIQGDILNTALKRKYDGIFTSPPYFGLIDYHEQHRYAYELLDINRLDSKEIGAKFKGESKEAKKEYIAMLTKVFNNLKPYLKEKAKIFIVANDKENLFPKIFNKSNLKLINIYNSKVNNLFGRFGKNYKESVFKLRLK